MELPEQLPLGLVVPGGLGVSSEEGDWVGCRQMAVDWGPQGTSCLPLCCHLEPRISLVSGAMRASGGEGRRAGSGLS